MLRTICTTAMLLFSLTLVSGCSSHDWHGKDKDHCHCHSPKDGKHHKHHHKMGKECPHKKMMKGECAKHGECPHMKCGHCGMKGDCGVKGCPHMKDGECPATKGGECPHCGKKADMKEKGSAKGDALKH